MKAARWILSFSIPATLCLGFFIPGHAQWVRSNGPEGGTVNTVTWDAKGWASGVYIYRLQSGDFVSSQRLILLK